MRKINLFYFVTAILFGLAISFSSCTKEGPAGPAGANGTDGTNGVDGSDGTPGVDANTHCLNCHTAMKMGEIDDAFASTPHVGGSSWARGTSGSCGACHSHDGYVEYTRSGEMIGAAVATPLVCGSCHGDHASLEDDATAPMREVGPVVAIVDETGETVFDHGMGNICATCHQSRREGSSYDNATEDMTYERNFTGDDYEVYLNAAVGPNGSITEDGDTLRVVFDVPTSNVYVNSTHAGPHHGPQSNVFAGIAGYPENGMVFDRDHHTDCAGCHLYNEEGYGHTFEPDVTGCNECHGEAFDMGAMQADVVARMTVIGGTLAAIHAIHFDEEFAPHPMYASLTRDQFQAFWNFMCIYEDASAGIHNPDYTEQMLTVAENALGL
ncbi:collagen-like protein [Desulfosarcina sp.]|nr:collagen-like protein [Desulfosarcina sp.]